MYAEELESQSANRIDTQQGRVDDEVGRNVISCLSVK